MLLGTALPARFSRTSCCDLLSFSYLCAIRNSDSASGFLVSYVVICFHLCIFVLLGTTIGLRVNSSNGCDLLSFHYLCAIRNS